MAVKRTLGDLGSKLLTTLSAEDNIIFTAGDAQIITGTSMATTRRMINRLLERKWLVRLAPGRYLIVPLSAGEQGETSENWYVVAKHLIAPNPYYLSHYSALDIHEMITQPLMTVFITTTKRRESRSVLGASFQFIHTSQSRLWGIDEVWVKPEKKVSVSDLERTIIDCLDNPKYCGGVSELGKGLWYKRDEIDYTKLVKYVDRFGSKAVAKRLGFLLELYGIGGAAVSGLKTYNTPGYVSLDPSLPIKGQYLNRWHLRVNLDPEELKDIVKT